MKILIAFTNTLNLCFISFNNSFELGSSDLRTLIMFLPLSDFFNSVLVIADASHHYMSHFVIVLLKS